MSMHDLPTRDPGWMGPAPRCNTKPQASTRQDAADAEGYGVTFMLGIATCVSAFIIVYSGWSF
jgi:hypothetical protein